VDLRAAREASTSFFGTGSRAAALETRTLARALEDLHQQLGFYADLTEFDAAVLLRPFLSVVDSTATAAHVTSAALDSIHKFLLYGLLAPDVPGTGEALGLLVQSIVGFQSQIDGAGETGEILFLKALEILLESVRCSAGALLSNNHVFRLFEFCHSIRSDRFSTPLLVQYADHFLMQFILCTFVRLPQLPASSFKRNSSVSDIASPEGKESDAGSEPFGELAMVKILYSLSKGLNPDDYKNDKESRELCLRLINVALETAGSSIGNSALLIEVIQDELCKRLLQNSQTSHPFILSLTLRTIFNLFSSIKEHLAVQLEVFFTSIHLRIAESKAATVEQKLLVLESFVEFCNEPGLLVGLFRNYDCEVSATNLYEDLCKFVCQQAIPATDSVEKQSFHRADSEEFTIPFLSFEAVLAILRSISKQFAESNVPGSISDEGDSLLSGDSVATGLSVDSLEERRQKKSVLRSAVSMFNHEGPKCFRALQTSGFFADPLSASAVAKFFSKAPGLDRGLVGVYLGMPDPFNQEVLKEYVKEFDMQKKRIDDALRVFLESFVLPGEAQIIERIMEAFADHYFAHSQGSSISNRDAAFVLAFSIIMLNTDAHKSQVNTKMTLEQWILNNRGINNGADFPRQYLESIYYSIQNSAIRIQSQSIKDLLPKDGSSISSLEWKKLISKSRKLQFQTSAAQSIGKEMFSIVSSSAVQILQFYLLRANDTKVLQRIVEGYHSFCRTCTVYKLREPFNNLLISLSNSLSANLEVCANDPLGFSPHTSFGRNNRAQRICSLLFNLLLGYRCTIIEAWPNIFNCLLWLNHINLLPQEFMLLDDFRDSRGKPLPSILFENLDNFSHSSPRKDELSQQSSLPFFFLARDVWVSD
jgi:brefeldin A-resistance guanine nucleotide exchange factor 1